MHYTIDRFEGSFAVCECEDGSFINIPKEEIPIEANEGDIIYEDIGGFEIDLHKTSERKEKMKKILDDLWQ